MKKLITSNPMAKPNDTNEMRDAIEALNREGARFSRPSQYQLKIGDINFYPSTGRIFRDSENEAWERRGLDELISCLRTMKNPTRNVLTFSCQNDTEPSPVIDLTSLY